MATLTRIPELFDGFDSFKGQALSTPSAVSGTTQANLNGSSSNTVSICTDSDSVTSAISVSASVSDVSASAKASWVQSLSITSTSVVVVVHTVVQSFTQTDSVKLTVPAPSSDEIQTFFENHGDSWVSELLVGAEYYAAFVYDSTTSEQQEQIKTQLSGSAGNLSGSLGTTLTNTSSSTKTSMRINQQMLGPTTLDYPAADADSIVNFALDFNSQVKGQYTVLAYGVTGYEDNGVTDFGAVVKNRNLLGTGSVSPWADAMETLTALLSQINIIGTMYNSYGYTGDTEFSKRAGQVAQDYIDLNQLINSIEKDVTGTYLPPQLPSLAYGTPLVTYTLASNPSTGSDDIVLPNDLDTSQIANGVKASSIIVLSSGFQVTYSDGSVVTHGDGSEVGGLSLNDDFMTVIGFKEHNSYDIGEIQTAKGKSFGSSGSWTYAKSPPLIIGFSAGTFQINVMSPVFQGAAALNITMLPAVWVQSTSS